jgi:hypothetical protein
METQTQYKDGYIRPNKTKTDELDEDQIVDKLMDYKKIETINELVPKMHIRYFLLEVDKKKGTVTRKFRMGGFIVKVDPVEKYVVLSNGKASWSIQFDNVVIYRKLSISEIKEEYETDLEKAQKVNNKLMSKFTKLNQSYEILKTNYDEIKNEKKQLIEQNNHLKKTLKKLGYTIQES